jgi:hypothetical protein
VTFPSPSEAEAILAALAAEPSGVSLPRLCKRLGLRMSVLLRTLAWLGEDEIGGVPGPGWVRVVRDGGRNLAILTDAGRARLASGAPSPG